MHRRLLQRPAAFLAQIPHPAAKVDGFDALGRAIRMRDADQSGGVDIAHLFIPDGVAVQ